MRRSWSHRSFLIELKRSDSQFSRNRLTDPQQAVLLTWQRFDTLRVVVADTVARTGLDTSDDPRIDFWLTYARKLAKSRREAWTGRTGHSAIGYVASRPNRSSSRTRGMLLNIA